MKVGGRGWLQSLSYTKLDQIKIPAYVELDSRQSTKIEC